MGAQRPRILWEPDRDHTLGDIASDLLELAGKYPDDWQRFVLDVACGQVESGRFSAFEVVLNCPRQNGKNVCIEARELLGLFLLREPVIIHSAHQFKTARKSFNDLQKMIRTTPSMYERVLGYRPGMGVWDEIKGIKSNGAEMSVEIDHGEDENGNRVTSKLEYQARSSGGGRGFTGDLIVLDEAYDLSDAEIAAMMPTMAARSIDGNPQIWYTSSAGLPDSFVLAKLRERALAGNEAKLAYFEWSAADDADSGDVDAWYQANPALGVRIAEEYVRDTEYASMGDEQFRRERLGILAPIGGDSAITASEWGRCLDVESEPSDHLVFAVDVPPARDMAAIAVCSVLDDGRRHVEVIDQREGTSWVAARLSELVAKWSPRAVIVDEGSAAGALVPEFRAHRVRHTPLSMRQYAQACGAVFDAVQSRALVHTGQAELDGAVNAAQMKSLGESLWRWNRRTAVANISPLAAVTMAWHGATIAFPTPVDTGASERSGGRRPVGRRVSGRSAGRRG